MDGALNSIPGPWAQLGITRSFVIALTLVNIGHDHSEPANAGLRD